MVWWKKFNILGKLHLFGFFPKVRCSDGSDQSHAAEPWALTPDLWPLNPDPSPLSTEPWPLSPGPWVLAPESWPLTPEPRPLTPEPWPLNPEPKHGLRTFSDSQWTDWRKNDSNQTMQQNQRYRLLPGQNLLPKLPTMQTGQLTVQIQVCYDCS